MKKYTAQITEDSANIKYEIDGYASSPQEFHKIVLFEHIKYPYEDILAIFNDNDKRVFNVKGGFSGS